MNAAHRDALYHWAILSDCYFATALLLCDTMLNGWTKPDTLIQGDLQEIGALPTPHPKYELIRPLVYNFKHGIELSIKGIGCIDFVLYAYTHDLTELFSIAIQKASSDARRDAIVNLRGSVWPTIEKYYNGTYIPEDFHAVKCDEAGNPLFLDRKNEAERYPEVNPEECYQVPWSISSERYASIEAALEAHRTKAPTPWITRALVERIRGDVCDTARVFDEAKDLIYKDQVTEGQMS